MTQDSSFDDTALRLKKESFDDIALRLKKESFDDHVINSHEQKIKGTLQINLMTNVMSRRHDNCN